MVQLLTALVEKCFLRIIEFCLSVQLIIWTFINFNVNNPDVWFLPSYCFISDTTLSSSVMTRPIIVPQGCSNPSDPHPPPPKYTEALAMVNPDMSPGGGAKLPPTFQLNHSSQQGPKRVAVVGMFTNANQYVVGL